MAQGLTACVRTLSPLVSFRVGSRLRELRNAALIAASSEESWSRSTRPRPPPKAGKLRGVYPERSRRAQGDRESKLLTHALRTHARSDETGWTRRGLDFVAAGRHPTGMLRHSLLEFVSPRCGLTWMIHTAGRVGGRAQHRRRTAGRGSFMSGALGRVSAASPHFRRRDRIAPQPRLRSGGHRRTRLLLCEVAKVLRYDAFVRRSGTPSSAKAEARAGNAALRPTSG